MAGGRDSVTAGGRDGVATVAAGAAQRDGATETSVSRAARRAWRALRRQDQSDRVVGTATAPWSDGCRQTTVGPCIVLLAPSETGECDRLRRMSAPRTESARAPTRARGKAAACALRGRAVAAAAERRRERRLLWGGWGGGGVGGQAWAGLAELYSSEGCLKETLVACHELLDAFPVYNTPPHPPVRPRPRPAPHPATV